MNRLLSAGATLTVLGALAWLVKVGVIVATDGRVTDEGVAAVLFGMGGLLLLVGLATLAVHLSRHRARSARVLAALGAAAALAVSVVGLTVVAGSLVPASVPQHLTDEVSTVLASLGWGAAALVVVRQRPARTARAGVDPAVPSTGRR